MTTIDTDTLIKKLAATTAPRRVMTGVCDALIERDKLRAELDTMKAALKPFADAYTASVDAHEYDINAGPPPWDFLEDWTVWMTARDAMKEDKA